MNVSCDWTHAKYLGSDLCAFGAVLYLWTFHVGPGNEQDNLRTFDAFLKNFYRTQRPQAGIAQCCLQECFRTRRVSNSRGKLLKSKPWVCHFFSFGKRTRTLRLESTRKSCVPQTESQTRENPGASERRHVSGTLGFSANIQVFMFLSFLVHEVALRWLFPVWIYEMVLIQASLVKFVQEHAKLQEHTKQKFFARQFFRWHMFIITLKYISVLKKTHQRTFLLWPPNFTGFATAHC